MEALPTEPMICLDTGMHTAIIRRIATDAAEQYLATASDDKTLRVWSLPDGRLLRTLRVPTGYGNFGKLYSVALSPDGQTVAGDVPRADRDSLRAATSPTLGSWLSDPGAETRSGR